VTGDFIVTAKLDLRNRSGSLGPPDANRFSYAGLMVRRARNMTACAPDPGFGPEVTLPWPPPPEGDPLHYVTDWAPYTENYL
ncbi:MAG: hypothetical protein GWO24_24120, partial [Akkermansiaceae bacterium]|nr:hypothetical protein [Akkermansiaceae bacterium]